jgi:hypothetical protein
LLQIINAPITPGIHAQRVRIKTINIEPHPLSITASGGNMMQSITRQSDIVFNFKIHFFIRYAKIRRILKYLVTKIIVNEFCVQTITIQVKPCYRLFL